MADEKKPQPSRLNLKAGPALGHTWVLGQLTVISYPERLLRLAQRLINEEEYSIAVVVMHMACEVATELATRRIRKRYNNAIQDKPFWQSFAESSKRRNEIVHRSRIANKSEAEQSLEATSKLVVHLTQRGVDRR